MKRPLPIERAPSLSVVIPTLNAAASLAECLACLVEARGCEVIVVDGGSTDATVAISGAAGARVHLAPRGRGVQLKAGARLAGRQWLLFLHADTRLSAGWVREIEQFVARPDARNRAATFRFGLDDPDWRARLLERLVSARVRLFGLAYGDQGLLIHREFYERLGGYAELPLMEDVHLIRRIGRSRLTVLAVTAWTSAARWRREGWLRRSARNLACLALYRLGVSPQKIARFYG